MCTSESFNADRPQQISTVIIHYTWSVLISLEIHREHRNSSIPRAFRLKKKIDYTLHNNNSVGKFTKWVVTWQPQKFWFSIFVSFRWTQHKHKIKLYVSLSDTSPSSPSSFFLSFSEFFTYSFFYHVNWFEYLGGFLEVFPKRLYK